MISGRTYTFSWGLSAMTGSEGVRVLSITEKLLSWAAVSEGWEEGGNDNIDKFKSKGMTLQSLFRLNVIP